MIDIRNVSHHYGSIWALHDVSLQVKKGSVLGLLGQNGAGKTTLLNIICGCLAPSSGNVLIDGADPLLQPRQAKSKLGYLPERPPLHDEMTVQEYLSYVAQLRGVLPKAAAAHVDEILHLTDLWELRSRLNGRLSKGQRQRVGFAQALCGDCEVLVLDEPTSGLDPKQIVEMRDLIRALSADRTIVFSSHMLNEVEQLCDSVAILHNGQLRLSCPIRDIGREGEDVVLNALLAAPAERAISVLERLEGAVECNRLPYPHSGHVEVLLRFHGISQPERLLFTACRENDWTIERLSREGGSLEQVFLGILSGKGDAEPCE